MHRTLCIWLLSIIGQESAAAVMDSIKLHPNLNHGAREEINEIFNYWYLELEWITCNINIDPNVYFHDADNDGVIDRYDEEPNTTAFAAVDMHGVTSDFDRDGCPDDVDPEPNSSLLLPIADCVNLRIADTRPEENVVYDPHHGVSTYFETPMVLFDPASSAIRPDAMPTLNQLSDILIRYTRLNLKIGVSSHVSEHDISKGKFQLSLASSRSTNVVQYLLEKGVQIDQIYVVHLAIDDLNYVKNDSGIDPETFDVLNRSTVFEVLLSDD